MSDTRTPGQLAYEAHQDALRLEYPKHLVQPWEGWWSGYRDRWEKVATAVREADAKEIAKLRDENETLRIMAEISWPWLENNTGKALLYSSDPAVHAAHDALMARLDAEATTDGVGEKPDAKVAADFLTTHFMETGQFHYKDTQ